MKTNWKKINKTFWVYHQRKISHQRGEKSTLVKIEKNMYQVCRTKSSKYFDCHAKNISSVCFVSQKLLATFLPPSHRGILFYNASIKCKWKPKLWFVSYIRINLEVSENQKSWTLFFLSRFSFLPCKFFCSPLHFNRLLNYQLPIVPSPLTHLCFSCSTGVKVRRNIRIASIAPW